MAEISTRHRPLVAQLLSLTALCFLAQPARAGEQADLVITNARIFTGLYKDERQPGSMAPVRPQLAEAIGCRSGKIIFVGDKKSALALAGKNCVRLDLGGKLLLPGFHDCHVHLCEGGIEASDCQLSGSKNKADALKRLKIYTVSHKSPGDKWIKGSGLPLPAVQNNPLTRLDLDAVSTENPVIVYSEDAHSLWLNTRALALAKIDASTKTPVAGVIEHLPDGTPSGCLREEAMELVEETVPVPPLAERAAALKKVVLLANSYGITSIQDAHAREEFLETYYELARQDKLNLRVVAALHVGAGFVDKDFDHLEELRRKYQTGNLHPTSAKIFSDGVIETHTAAMLEPYSNDSANSGTLYYEPAELKRLVLALDKRGFQIHIHAIGDRAVRTALDAFEAAKAASNGDYEAHRHQMAHLEIVDKADQERFKKLSVIANFQAYWAFNDPYMLELTVPSLGDRRMQLIYPIHTIAATGARLAAGSDWTVSSLNPLMAMQVAMTRQTPGEPGATVLLPQERVSLADTLAAYTTGGAWANHSEESTGQLAVGKDADMIVLDKNIFDLPPTKIGQAKVLKTFFRGKVVYDRSRDGNPVDIK